MPLNNVKFPSQTENKCFEIHVGIWHSRTVLQGTAQCNKGKTYPWEKVPCNSAWGKKMTLCAYILQMSTSQPMDIKNEVCQHYKFYKQQPSQVKRKTCAIIFTLSSSQLHISQRDSFWMNRSYLSWRRDLGFHDLCTLKADHTPKLKARECYWLPWIK